VEKFKKGVRLFRQGRDRGRGANTGKIGGPLKQPGVLMGGKVPAKNAILMEGERLRKPAPKKKGACSDTG